MVKIKFNRGQAEFFGLVIIVFLLSIGLIFVISLKSNKDNSSIKSSYLDQVLSKNLINSMLNMRTECYNGVVAGKRLIQLITNCVEKGSADKGSIRCDNFMDSCEYASSTISVLLNETLGKWNKPFYFDISGTNITFATEGCDPELNVEREPPGIQPFPTKSGNSLMFLMICKMR